METILKFWAGLVDVVIYYVLWLFALLMVLGAVGMLLKFIGRGLKLLGTILKNIG